MSSPTILVIDDNPDVLKFIRDTLANEGYHTLTALSAEQATRILATHPVAVVVLDLVLPGMGGMEFAWRILEGDPHPGVILISGYADGEAAVSALDAPRLSFLDKPFTAEQLLDEVRGHLARDAA